jgi:hypothetical protein
VRSCLRVWQARTDFAAIESNLEFIMGQLARVLTRKQLARYSLLVMVGTASLVHGVMAGDTSSVTEITDSPRPCYIVGKLIAVMAAALRIHALW